MSMATTACSAQPPSADAERRDPQRPLVDYPFSRPPEIASGEPVEIVPGIFWFRMPLKSATGFINVWAIEDGTGVAIVDTGISSEPTKAAWRKAFAECLAGRHVTKVIVTHLHQDHIGLAGWFCRRFGCELIMTRLEYLHARLLAGHEPGSPPESYLRFYKAAGLGEEALEAYRLRFGIFPTLVSSIPESYRRIEDGDTIHIGENPWRVVTGAGHSPEHACLYCERLKLVITGDQILPRITSNVSVFPLEPDADPLGDWLTSLEKLKGALPEGVLALPAHDEPFIGVHSRMTYMAESRQRALARLEGLLEVPRLAIDVFPALFTRTITQDLVTLATGEALAHLNHLRRQGRATSRLDDAGKWLYRAVASGPGRESAPR
jgi:glyoxylase-like metal-dependent hydrolase (beta-lactamase superfamily II)